MRALFLIFVLFFAACDQVEDKIDEAMETGVSPEPITECIEGRTRCDDAKEFVFICENGFWWAYSDCYEVDKTCVLHKGRALCKRHGDTSEEENEFEEEEGEGVEEGEEEGDDEGEDQCRPGETDPVDEDEGHEVELDDPIMGDPLPVEEDYRHCYQGTFTVSSYGDVSLIENYSCINGDLVYQANLEIVNLQRLKEITGSIIFNGGNVNGPFGATELKKVGKDIRMMFTPITNLGLDSLETVGGDFVVSGNSRLRGLHVPSLTDFGYLQVTDNPSLTCEDGNFDETFDINEQLVCDNKNCGTSNC